MKKSEILEMPTTAYYSGWGMIEIKDIRWDCGYWYIYYVDGIHHKPHKVRLYDDTVRSYFFHNGIRIHLDECIRTNVV